MTARDQILADIRAALGRASVATPARNAKPAAGAITLPSAAPAPLVAPLLRHPHMDRNLYVPLFVRSLEKLAGKAFVVPNPDAVADVLRPLMQAKQAVASNAPFLKTCGVTALDRVHSGFMDRAGLRSACATTDIGITSADYALAETGSLVMLSSVEEARLISLLPPVHVAVIPRSRILANLDELLATIPKPADRTSSMVLITGGSRTADIEQILIRGVHGPGEVYTVIVENS